VAGARTIRRTIQQLRRKPFVRDFTVMVSGTALAQGVSLIAAPIVSRIYDPAAVGVFGAFASLVTVLASTSTLKFNEALMLPGEERDAVTLLSLSLASVGLISALTLGVALRMDNLLDSLIGSTVGVAWVLNLPLAVLVSGCYVSFTGWAARQKRFAQISGSQIGRSAGSNIVQIGAGLVAPGPGSLIAGLLTGEALGCVSIAARVLRWDRGTFAGAVTWERVKRVARAYVDFPMFTNTQGLLSAISQNMPVLLLVHFFGTTVAGYYSFGVRLIQWPMNLVLVSLRQVLFQKASEAYNSGQDTYRIFRSVTLILLAVGLVPAFALFVFAPGLFGFVLGEQWVTAGIYARWLIPWMFFMFANVPTVLFSQIYRRQRMMLLFDITLLIARAAALTIGGLYLTALQSLILYSIAGALINAAIILAMWRVLDAERRSRQP
jgi:O-antigen/teichoic acid export membrane protein